MTKGAFTIFGGTGDLTFRKLLPALYNLTATNQLPPQNKIVIIGRRDYQTQEYSKIAREWVEKFARLKFQEECFQQLIARLEYFKMDFTNLNSYEDLDQYYKEQEIDAHIFYLAVAPRFFGTIAEGLQKVKGAEQGKVILEKPFGEDLQKAKALNQKLEEFFTPERVYRIDHYLGKEMVRNIQTIRFTNPIFSDCWDSAHIENVQISAMEEVGVETRGGYYDTSGALKDMVQNHMFQILSILAMEKPDDFRQTEEIHAKQLEVLRAVRPISAGDIARTMALGQYEGYRQEQNVAPDSNTETFAALGLYIENQRWRGTPFYIRTGKKPGRREMEVAIVFRRSFPHVQPDVLVIKIQPIEGIYLQFNIKKPGNTEETIQAKMDFCQSCSLENRINTPEAYERLLMACIKGERAWFSQWEQIETGWQFVEDLHRQYVEAGLPVYRYQEKTEGPAESNRLLEHQGHRWFQEITENI